MLRPRASLPSTVVVRRVLKSPLRNAEDVGLVRLLVDPGNVERAAWRTAVLVTIEVRPLYPVAIVEVVVRIESTVPVELEQVSVETVGSGFGDDVDDVSAAPAILRGEGVGLDLELLDVFDRGNVDDAAPVLRGVPGSVEQIGRGAEVGTAEVQE